MAFNKEKVMDAAQKFVEKGQIDKAIKEYLRIVDEDPKDVRVWLKIGDLYAKKGAKQEATETYLKVARFYHDQGFYLKAVAVYKQILKLDPRLVDVNLKLAELYRQLGLLSDAMQHYESVAAFFHREGKTKEALATVKQLVELDPENIATRIKLAELYSKEGMAERGGRRVRAGVRAAAPPGPPGRLHEGRRAPAVAQARQPRAEPRARRAVPASATIRAARCRSCRSASRPIRATSRRSALLAPGVPGARPEGQDGQRAQGARAHPRREHQARTRRPRSTARSSRSCRRRRRAGRGGRAPGDRDRRRARHAAAPPPSLQTPAVQRVTGQTPASVLPAGTEPGERPSGPRVSMPVRGVASMEVAPP